MCVIRHLQQPKKKGLRHRGDADPEFPPPDKDPKVQQYIAKDQAGLKHCFPTRFADWVALQGFHTDTRDASLVEKSLHVQDSCAGYNALGRQLSTNSPSTTPRTTGKALAPYGVSALTLGPTKRGIVGLRDSHSLRSFRTIILWLPTPNPEPKISRKQESESQESKQP